MIAKYDPEAEQVKASKEEAPELEALFEAILQGVDEAVMVRGTRVAPGDTIVYANERAAHLLGFDSVSDLLAIPTGEMSARYEFYNEAGQFMPYDRLPSRLAFEGQSVPPCVLRFRTLPGGEERWAILRTIPIKGPEQVQTEFVVSIFSDITDRRQAQEALKTSEARFHAFMDNSPIVAFLKDEEKRFVYASAPFARLWNKTAEEIVGTPDSALVPEDVIRRIHEDDEEMLSTGRLKEIIELIPTPDGSSRYFVTFKFPVTDQSGRRFIGGASVDITERIEAQEALQQYAERLQALSRQLIQAQENERRRISRELHDQIGQALTAIKIDLQLAQHQALTDAGSPGVYPESLGASIDKSIQMVERTIQQVREFSLDLRPSILDDLGLPSALLWYVEEQAKRAGFKVELAVERLSPRLPPELEVTCFRIAQEAVTNVVRHAQASKVLIELRQIGHELVLTVKDDGVGFDAQALAPDVARSGNGEGANEVQEAAGKGPKAAKIAGETRETRELGLDKIRTLGLAGMYERVLLVGGSLSIRSMPGAGTVVRAAFPLGDDN